MSSSSIAASKYRIQFSNPQGLEEKYSTLEVKEEEIYAPKDLDLRMQCIGEKVIIYKQSDGKAAPEITSVIVLEDEMCIGAEITQIVKSDLDFYTGNMKQQINLDFGNGELYITAPQRETAIISFSEDQDMIFSKDGFQGPSVSEFSSPHFTYKISRIPQSNPQLHKISVKDLKSENGTAIRMCHNFSGDTKIDKLFHLSLDKEYRFWQQDRISKTVKSIKFVVTKILTNEKISNNMKELVLNRRETSTKVYFFHK